MTLPEKLESLLAAKSRWDVTTEDLEQALELLRTERVTIEFKQNLAERHAHGFRIPVLPSPVDPRAFECTIELINFPQLNGHGYGKSTAQAAWSAFDSLLLSFNSFGHPVWRPL